MHRLIRAIARRLNPFAGVAEFYHSLSSEQQELWWEVVHETRPRRRT